MSREVEQIIYQDSRVSEVAVIGPPHPEWIEAVIAFVVPKKGEIITENEIIELCRTKLAHFKVPKDVVFLEELPKTVSGKLLKTNLREKLDNYYN